MYLSNHVRVSHGLHGLLKRVFVEWMSFNKLSKRKKEKNIYKKIDRKLPYTC